MLPPGCLVLDGEALLWQEFEEPSPHQEPLLFGSRSSRLPGHKALSMRTSSSSPNLVLLADSSGVGALEDGQQQQQTHQPLQHLQQQSGCSLLPMHSSQSCDSLLSLCQPGGSALGTTYPPGAAGGYPGSTAAKSRLGRPTSEGTPSQQRQQQQSTADSSMTGAPAASINADCVQQQSPLHGMSPQQEMLQLQQLRPVAVGRGSSGDGCDNVPGVSSWAFSRCNSGLSLGSEALLGRRLLLHTVTFNMNGKLPSSLPPELLGPLAAAGGGGGQEGSVSLEGDTGAPDLLVIATQVGWGEWGWVRCCGVDKVLLQLSAGLAAGTRMSWELTTGSVAHLDLVNDQVRARNVQQSLQATPLRFLAEATSRAL